MILLDTHVALWFVQPSESLGSRSRILTEKALDDAGVALSVIPIWEIALLIAKKRVSAIDSIDEIRRRLLSTGMQELPLTAPIASLSVQLGFMPTPPTGSSPPQRSRTERH